MVSVGILHGFLLAVEDLFVWLGGKHGIPFWIILIASIILLYFFHKQIIAVTKILFKKWWILLIIVAIILISVVGSLQNNWIIDGDRVYVNDSKVFISATPHTVTSGGWVTFNFTSKVYTGNIDMVFGFDTSQTKPQKIELYKPTDETREVSYTCEGVFNYTTNPNYFWCYENVSIINNETNETTYELRLVFDHYYDTGHIPSQTAYWSESYIDEWKDFSSTFNSLNYNYKGMNKWWFNKNIPIVQGTEYIFRVKIDLLNNSFNEPKRKYWFAIKPSHETLPIAILLNHFYALDPWTSGLNVGLVSYYKLDEGSGAIIDSHGVYNMTNNGTSNTAGKINSAYDFETSSRVDNAWTDDGVVGLDDVNSVSVSVWIKLESYGDAIVHCDNLDDTKDYFTLRDVGGGGTINWYVPAWDNVVTDALDTGVWWHLVGTHDGDADNLTIYVNGEINATKGFAETMGSNPPNITLSSMRGDTSLYDGVMDEVGIWNRSLTPAEVMQLYNSGDGLAYASGLTVFLISPEDNTNHTRSTINFLGNVSNPYSAGIQNVSLLINGEINQTNSSGTEGIYNFSDVVIPDGNHNWTVLAYDDDDTSYEASNGTLAFMIDTTTPTITLPVYSNATLKKNTENLTLNISVIDALSGLTGSMCKININGTNQSVSVSSGWCNLTNAFLSGLGDGNKTIRVYANDTVGNLGLNDSYVVYMDSSSTNITINTPTGTSLSTTVPFNVSLAEVSPFDFCTAWVMRGAASEVSNTTLTCPNGTSGDITGNIVVSGDANYVFYVFVNDTLGNSETGNSSFTVDTSASSSGGGGGTPAIIQDQANQPSICQPFNIAFRGSWTTLKEDGFTWQNIKIFIQVLGDYIFCKAASVFVPL